MKNILFSISLLTILTNCFGQTTNTTLHLSDFAFKSYMGIYKTDSTKVYSLLNNIFAYHSDNSDSLIMDWMKKHPNAIVIPVATYGPTLNDTKEISVTYCWLVDTNDTINNYLVREGCFSAGTMKRSPTWSEMKRKEKAFYKGSQKPKVSVLIEKKSYDNFIEQITSAEKYAIDNKLGIWYKLINNLD